MGKAGSPIMERHVHYLVTAERNWGTGLFLIIYSKDRNTQTAAIVNVQDTLKISYPYLQTSDQKEIIVSIIIRQKISLS